MHAIDEYDKKLLRLLQRNNRLTTEELSTKVDLSQSAVQRRVARLRDEGVIEADVSIISAAFAGNGMTCIVDAILTEGNAKAIEFFKAEMKRSPEVSQCYYVTGTYDFVLVVNTRDMAHFEEFQKSVLLSNSNLKHFYTHVVMDRVKMNYGTVVS